MFRAIKLKDGEEILLIVRQTPIAFSTQILVGLFLFLLPFFLLFPLFSWGRRGIIIFGALVIGAIAFAIYQFIFWYFNCGIITNQRVIDIDQRSLFDRVISEVPYYKIDDISYNVKGLRQTLFGYGNVVIAIRGYRSSVTLRNIGRPAMVQELILGVERQVRGWDKAGERPMDRVMEEMDKLNPVERKALAVALKKIKKDDEIENSL
jgi:hypothetical protein